MPYTINKYNGELLTSINDGQIDTSSTSLRLLGKGSTNYGELTAENFIFLLENFARTNSPSNPLVGQLWYHLNANGTGNHILKICTAITPAIVWEGINEINKDAIGSAVGSGRPPLPSSGTTYWNGSQLEAYCPTYPFNGGWRIIGPIAPAANNTLTNNLQSDVYYDVITDSANVTHGVVVIATNGVPVVIFSETAASFTPKANTSTAKNTPLTKFTNISGGMNINSDFTTGSVFNPVSISTNLLPNGDANLTIGSVSKRWGIVYSRAIQFDYIRTSDVNGNWSGETDVRTLMRNNIDNTPALSNTYNLGGSSSKWKNVYGQTVNADTLSVGGSTIDFSKYMRLDASNEPTTSSTSLGSPITAWGKVYAGELHVNNIFLGLTGATSTTSVSILNFARKDDDIIPLIDSTNNIGSATNRYNNVYTNTATVATLTVSGTINNIAPANLVRTDLVQAFTKQHNFPAILLTGISIAWNLDNAQTGQVVLDSDKLINNPVGMVNGGRYTLIVQQDGVGNHVLAFPSVGSVYKFDASMSSNVMAAADSTTIYEFISDSAFMYCVNVKQFS
jgi:hypothetical protein